MTVALEQAMLMSDLNQLPLKIKHLDCSFELFSANEHFGNTCHGCIMGPCLYHEVSAAYEEAKPFLFPPMGGVMLTEGIR